MALDVELPEENGRFTWVIKDGQDLVAVSFEDFRTSAKAMEDMFSFIEQVQELAERTPINDPF